MFKKCEKEKEEWKLKKHAQIVAKNIKKMKTSIGVADTISIQIIVVKKKCGGAVVKKEKINQAVKHQNMNQESTILICVLTIAHIIKNYNTNFVNVAKN